MENKAKSKSVKQPENDCIRNLSAVDDAIYVIGGKWKLKTIVALFDGGKRFTELQRLIKGISAKVLSHTLKELELIGFIDRIVHEEDPVAVEYQLTEYSQSLGTVIRALNEWGKNHRDKLRKVN